MSSDRIDVDPEVFNQVAPLRAYRENTVVGFDLVEIVSHY
jgi:hypothetical protein